MKRPNGNATVSTTKESASDRDDEISTVIGLSGPSHDSVTSDLITAVMVIARNRRCSYIIGHATRCDAMRFGDGTNARPVLVC